MAKGRGHAKLQSKRAAPTSRGTGGARWQVLKGAWAWEEQDLVVAG